MSAERLEILCDSQNDASRKVAEKAGYHLEALLRAEDRGNDGSLRDTVNYALLRARSQGPRGSSSLRFRAVRRVVQRHNGYFG